MLSISQSRRVGFASFAALAIVALSGAGSFASSQASTVPRGGTITMVDTPNGPDADDFNPWSPNNPASGVASIFEPLLYFNLYTGSITPKLAASYHYTDGHKQIVFNLRHGVKWSNGTAFTAKDVVFTMDMLIKNPAIDLNGLSSMIASATANSTYQVTVDLKTANVTDLYYIGGDTPIVPESQWGSVKNPATFTDPHPVTTGPFTVGSVTRDELVLVRNAHYWDSPEPYVSKIVYPATIDTNTANLSMAQGNFTLGEQYIPTIQRVLLDKSSHYGDWFPQLGEDVLFLNDAKYPLSLLPFRKALNDVINRTEIAKVGEEGYLSPANAAGLPVNPLTKPDLDSAVLSKYAPHVSLSEAKATLKKAGFHWTHGTLIDPKGKAVSMTVLALSGAPDWVSDGSIMVTELRTLGINAIEKTPSGSTIVADLGTGQYQAAIWSTNTGPGAYYEYYPLLDSAFSAPIGETAVSNYERWDNPTTDKLLNEYVDTFSSSKRRAILDQLEMIVAKNVPVIAFADSPAWEEYNSTQIVGFPSQQDPYAVLAGGFDNEYILAEMHRR